MATAMIHVFPSGNPQPSDILISIAILVTFVYFILKPSARITWFSLIALLFGSYTFTINMINYIFLPDLVFFKSSFYYFFNISLMLLIIWLFKQDSRKAWQYVYWGVILSVIIEFLFIKFAPNMRGFRATGTFSNPNQLAIWSLTVACLLVVLRTKTKMQIIDYIAFLTLGFMQTLSLSKAGIICFVLLGFSIIFSKATSLRVKFLTIMGLVVVSIFAVENVEFIDYARGNFANIDKTVSRIEKIGTEDDESLEGRNYTRIFNNPEYLLVGAGEGGYFRFGDSAKNLEIHSGLGTLIFCYGVIGTVLFFGMLFVVVKKTNYYTGFLIGILLLYGLTHQNIRSSHFWVFLGVAYGMAYVSPEGRRNSHGFSIPEHSQIPRRDSQVPQPG